MEVAMKEYDHNSRAGDGDVPRNDACNHEKHMENSMKGDDYTVVDVDLKKGHKRIGDMENYTCPYMFY